METYFKLKIVSEFIVPLLFVIAFILVSLYYAIKSKRRSWLMKKLGYTYNYAGGPKVSYQFQSRWEKGPIKINCREIEYMDYPKIKGYVQSLEENYNHPNGRRL